MENELFLHLSQCLGLVVSLPSPPLPQLGMEASDTVTMVVTSPVSLQPSQCPLVAQVGNGN